MEPLGELDGARDGVAVVREALGHLVGREQHALAVAAPLALAAVERGAAADRDEHVLERERGAGGARARRRSRRSRRRASRRARAGARCRRASPRSYGRWSSTKKRSRPKAAASRAAAFGSRTREPVPRAAREADEALVALDQRRRAGSSGGSGSRAFLRARSRMRRGEQPAEVRVALRRLDEQRHVRAARERHLGAGDRADAERLRRVRELERAVDAVVVGERERLVAELRRARGELLRLRRPVEERVGRVAVELDVAHDARSWTRRCTPGPARASGSRTTSASR